MTLQYSVKARQDSECCLGSWWAADVQIVVEKATKTVDCDSELLLVFKVSSDVP